MFERRMVEHFVHKVQANVIDSVLNSYVHVDENNGLFIYLLTLKKSFAYVEASLSWLQFGETYFTK